MHPPNLIVWRYLNLAYFFVNSTVIIFGHEMQNNQRYNILNMTKLTSRNLLLTRIGWSLGTKTFYCYICGIY